MNRLSSHCVCFDLSLEVKSKNRRSSAVYRSAHTTQILSLLLKIHVVWECFSDVVYKALYSYEGGIGVKWEAFERAIRQECRHRRKSSEYTEKYIGYAKGLFEKNLPLIVSPEHLSMLIGLDYRYMCAMAYSPENFYRHFTIKKASGKDRKIDEPLPDLKFVQHWILANILQNCPVSKYAKAFVKGRTLKHNARFHRAQSVVVTMDIRDFFPSIRLYDVFSIYRGMGYWDNVAWFLANLCCLKKVLPQGAPTSPYLSNLRLLKLDEAIEAYISTEGIRYTRYADDMTFSGNLDPHQVILTVSRLIYAQGFQINVQKTRVAYQNARQEVTGIVVNDHMQVSKEQRKHIRQQMYYITKFGLDSHLAHIGETRQNYLSHLMGQINFALFVNPRDKELGGYFHTMKNLLNDSKNY